MSTYPVHYAVPFPARSTRLQLAVRLVAFVAVGMITSFGALMLFAYLALPVIAVSRLAAGVAPEAYLREDAPRVLRILRWTAAVSAWAALIADRLPAHDPDEIVTLTVNSSAHPTVKSAAMRVLTGLPSALVLALLGCMGGLVWLWAALCILVSEQVGQGAFDFLVGVQRWAVRLLVYQASLVDEYPPFSFADDPAGSGVSESLAR